MDVLLLAVEAAIYPTLLAAVVILLSQPSPRKLLATYLAGGLLISISLGLIIVFTLHGTGAVNNERSTFSWTEDLAAGGLLLLVAVMLATQADQRMRARRAARKGKKEAEPEPSAEKEPWSQRLLARGSVPIVFGAALAINVPGLAYLIGLKDIAASGESDAVKVAAVLGFNLIMFILAEVPLLGLWLAPERTDAQVRGLNQWMSGHGRVLATGLCVVLGGYLVVRGVVHAP